MSDGQRLTIKYTLLAAAILCLPIMSVLSGFAFGVTLACGLLLVAVATWVRPR